MVTLTTFDGGSFVIDRDVAACCEFFNRGVEDGEPILLPQVPANVLGKVLEYCEYHKEELIRIARTDDDGTDHTTNIGEWDQEFIAVDQEMVFEIILAANYLNIKPLLNVGCKTVANMMRDKNPEEIRKLFNIVNDYTPEEEAQIQNENEWAEDH